MPETLSAFFPDRESAGHAIAELEEAGFSASRSNAEDFERPDYYANQMPQGATLVTADTHGQPDRVRTIVQRLGGKLLDALSPGSESTPTSWHGDVAGAIPTAPRETQALRQKQQDEESAFSATQRAEG